MLSLSLWNRTNESIPATIPPLPYRVYSIRLRRFPYPMAPFCIHYLCPHQLRNVPGFASPPYPPSPSPTSYRFADINPRFQILKRGGRGRVWTMLLPHAATMAYKAQILTQVQVFQRPASCLLNAAMINQRYIIRVLAVSEQIVSITTYHLVCLGNSTMSLIEVSLINQTACNPTPSEELVYLPPLATRWNQNRRSCQNLQQKVVGGISSACVTLICLSRSFRSWRISSLPPTAHPNPDPTLSVPSHSLLPK